VLTQPSLTITRRLNAPPAKIYAAWTDPKKVIRWFGPAHTVDGTVQAEMDVRPGGSFRISFKTDDGEYHQVGGTYRDVVPDQRLSFSWAWHTTPERESFVTVTLRPDGDGTLLSLNHGQFVDQAARDGHERGWMGTMDRLEQFLA